MKKLTAYQKLFRILGAPIKCSLTVCMYIIIYYCHHACEHVICTLCTWIRNSNVELKKKKTFKGYNVYIFYSDFFGILEILTF